MMVLYVPFFISGLYVRIQLPPEDTDTLIFKKKEEKKSILEKIQFTAYYSGSNQKMFLNHYKNITFFSSLITISVLQVAGSCLDTYRR